MKWEAIADDDFKAVIGDYTLRVERMDKNAWWWEVYWGDTCLAFWSYPNDGLYARSAKGAKRKATNFYKKHSNQWTTIKHLYTIQKHSTPQPNSNE